LESIIFKKFPCTYDIIWVLLIMALVEIPKQLNSNIKRHKQISNSVQQILQKLGLTQNESMVYLYLDKNKPKKAKEISQCLKLPRTQTYHLLTALQNKGLIIITSDRPTKFEGVEFEKVLDILIDYEQKRVADIQLMRSELCELWKVNF